jgi:hypothetical protein
MALNFLVFRRFFADGTGTDPSEFRKAKKFCPQIGHTKKKAVNAHTVSN